MQKAEDDSLSRFAKVDPLDRRILALAGAANFLLLIGAVASFRAGQTLTGSLLLLSLLASAAFLVLNIRHWKGLFAAADYRDLVWSIAIPDVQRAKLSEEVSDLAKTLNMSSEQVSDLLSAYIVAEDLALRQVQHETKLPLARHITIGKTPFDAVFARQDTITCVEVTFLVTSHLPQAKINVILNKLATAQKFLGATGAGARLRLLLVIVTQMDRVAETELRSTLARKFSATPVDVDIRLIDFDSLQRVFALN